MSGRSRLASARGARRGSRRAALGALVSTNFWISDREDGCTVRFSSILDEVASPVEITVGELDRELVTERLGPFLLRKDNTLGCIARGVALPWPALLALIGGDLPGTHTTRAISADEQRIQSMTEKLAVSVGTAYALRAPWASVRQSGDRWLMGSLRDFVSAMTTGKPDAPPCESHDPFSGKRWARYDMVSSDPLGMWYEDYGSCKNKKCALRPLQLSYLNDSRESEKPIHERGLETNRRIARAMNEVLADKVSEDVWRAIEDKAPHLCLEAVLTKVQSDLDAEVVYTKSFRPKRL